MKTSILKTIPLFCFMYYVMLMLLYGGEFYTVDNAANAYSVPHDWVITVGTFIFLLMSIFLPKWIKPRAVPYTILAVCSAALGGYGALQLWPHWDHFLNNGNYSLPMFAMIFVLCFAALTVAYIIMALRKIGEADEKAE